MTRPERGWWADIDEDGGANGFLWQPRLETGEGVAPSLPVWFLSREDCEEFIRRSVIGVGMLDD